MILPLFPISGGSVTNTSTLRRARRAVKDRRIPFAWLAAILALVLGATRTTAQEYTPVDRPLDDAVLHEVVNASDPTAACYPLTRPLVKRRAVGRGGPPCTSSPTLRFTAQPSACAGETVVLAWQASEPNARVYLRGIDLPASGSTTVIAQPGTTIRGIASTCSLGPEASAAIAIEPAPEITSFTADHPTLAPGAATTLHFSYEHATSWAIAGATPAGSAPLSGESSSGGSARVTFPSVPAEAILTAAGACGASVLTLPIRPCPGEGPTVDIGQTSGRVAVGQSQRWSFLLSPETERWSVETDDGQFTPAAGVRTASGEIETVFNPARAGEMSFTFLGENACGIRGIGGVQTVWNCAQPIMQSFTAGATTLAVGQSTYVSYVTQERHGEVGTVSSSLGNALGGAVHFPPPETRHTYTATHAGTDTVSVSVQTPCGPATASLQIRVQ